MKNILDSTLYAALSFRIYRYRFVLTYIVIGFLSLWIEVLVLRGLNFLGVSFIAARLAGLLVGVVFAFWMNARFNFKVPIAKRNRALLYFAGISAVSVAINFVFKAQLMELGWSYEQARFSISGGLFAFGYVLHRRFSFADRKQVGVAVYANGVEDIRGIREKIGEFPDFIHVDLIDASFGGDDTDVRSYRLETVRAYWPRLKIHVHLMTRHPSRWLKEVVPYADVILIHHEIDEPIDDVIQAIQQAHRTVGICLQQATPVEAVKPLLDRARILMLLSIPRPGQSGQTFQMPTLDRIEAINTWPDRSHFALCIDGGVNEKNVHLLNVELVVSGSSVLQATEPTRQIMRLQTSSNYEAV